MAKSENISSDGESFSLINPEKKAVINFNDEKLLLDIEFLYTSNKGIEFGDKPHAIMDDEGQVIKGDNTFKHSQHRIDRCVSELIVEFDSVENIHELDYIPFCKISDIIFNSTHKNRGLVEFNSLSLNQIVAKNLEDEVLVKPAEIPKGAASLLPQAGIFSKSSRPSTPTKGDETTAFSALNIEDEESSYVNEQAYR
jgi:hypothetical protein